MTSSHNPSHNLSSEDKNEFVKPIATSAVKVSTVAQKIRSKNAGPFWLTCDIFCGSEEAFQLISKGLSTDQVANAFQQPVDTMKRFDISNLHVVKFSLPRPVIQGSRYDSDMHGAQWSILLSECILDE